MSLTNVRSAVRRRWLALFLGVVVGIVSMPAPATERSKPRPAASAADQQAAPGAKRQPGAAPAARAPANKAAVQPPARAAASKAVQPAARRAAGKAPAQPAARAATGKAVAHPPARKPAPAASRNVKQPAAARTVRGRAPNARTAKARSGPVERVNYAPPRPTIGQAIGLRMVDDPLDLRSSVAVVIDQKTGETLFQKNPHAVLPIASITKVMSAMVVLDARLPIGEMLEITDADRDTERHSSSRLPVGTKLSRGEMLQLSLMSSENRAASALGRHYPGGLPAFMAAMNAKAQAIGMVDSRFDDPTGLSGGNVSNARDLALLVRAAHGYSEIRDFSTASDLTVDTGYRQVSFRSTNRLIADPAWDIGMQKTGFISEAGKCLVMQARIDDRSVIIVLLDASLAHERFSDAQRLRRWLLEHSPAEPMARLDTRS